MYMQRMVPSLSTRVRGGLSVNQQATTNCLQSDGTICYMYKVYPPEDEHLSLETCRGT